MTIIDALKDPNLFGSLDRFRDLKSWEHWIAFLKAVFALPMTEEELSIYTQHTGRETPPEEPVSEAYVAAGRRSGKTFMAALIAVYLAAFRDYSPYLAPGERAMVLAIATDRDQASILLRYASAFLTEIPLLAGLIENERADAIELNNRVTLAVATCSYRTVRGATLAAAICDEVAYWRVDGANPDREVLTALRPAMVTIPNPLLLCISTPYARSGTLYEAIRTHHGDNNSRVLTWKAHTTEMNPTISPSKIEGAYAQDGAAAASEYGAEFREDMCTFLSVDMIMACVETDRLERPPLRDVHYVAAVDPSGGGPDYFTLAIAHAEADKDPPEVVLDLIRGWRGDHLESVVVEIVGILRRYGIDVVIGDRYAGDWVRNAFERHGIAYEVATRSRSETYVEFHPLIATGRVLLLDHPTLLRELRQLERKTGRGKDIVDHPARQHDDHANAAALALVEAESLASGFVGFVGWVRLG
jgi:hypothetical protein